jgi:hypothetical protein
MRACSAVEWVRLGLGLHACLQCGRMEGGENRMHAVRGGGMLNACTALRGLFVCCMHAFTELLSRHASHWEDSELFHHWIGKSEFFPPNTRKR